MVRGSSGCVCVWGLPKKHGTGAEVVLLSMLLVTMAKVEPPVISDGAASAGAGEYTM